MNRDDYIDLYFAELDMGPRWRLRETRGAVSPGMEAAERAAQDAAVAMAEPIAETVNLQKKPDSAAPRIETSSGREKTVLAMPASTGRDGKTVPVGEVKNLDWAALEDAIRACKACTLCRQRRQAVAGSGDRQADWLLVGEGPGVEEDLAGEPFVGPSGKLLDNMLQAIGLQRGNGVFIGNAVKCRPPNNRTPEPGEINTCRPYLERQIALLQPKIIVLLGRSAAQSVLGRDESLASLRGQVHRYQGIPVVVTYHPAYLLRTLTDKAKAWEDLCLARQTVRASAA